ncbi:transmembrane and coiled-coil domains 5B [Chelydra serpentina]|uniref:Transmembrane and coiled-coil domains 5B n=1 Tax=Chelydra serpentina TaxID=8475 RepID=A0A8T1SQR8_CHESE|nr:transmembrane and coiled-coil domains 5B [Chelydra serpentina]
MSCSNRMKVLKVCWASFLSETTASLYRSKRHHQTKQMENSLIHNLSITNKNLQNQIWALRETAVELDAENQKLMKENKEIKDQNRRLQARADCFKTLVGDLQREVDNAREVVEGREDKINQLEFQNKYMEKINEQLNMEIMEMACQISAYHSIYQEKDIYGVRNIIYENKMYLKHLKTNLESEERLYEQEKLETCQLRETLEELDKIGEFQKNDIMQLEGQLVMSTQETALLRVENEDKFQAGSLLRQDAEIKFVENSLDKPKKHNFLCYIWNLLKLLLTLVVWLGLAAALVLLYTYVFNNDFIADSLPLLISDHDLDIIIQILSPYLIWKNDGLLPF